ncbi:MAG: YeeE/YedE family protein [Betaproteobacteria bacterium]|nr:MAG: YeeE/YedE family protein [Betaproteobacteria bacterium]
MYALSSFVAGLVFGFGLLVSGLVNPAKVLGFLDVAGAWDPSLALVMVGAVAVGAVAFAVAGRLTATLLGTPMALPTGRGIDRRLVLGSLAFGVGWGLAGFCPGPALVALGAGKLKALVFVGAMLAGMLVFELVERARSGGGIGPRDSAHPSA